MRRNCFVHACVRSLFTMVTASRVTGGKLQFELSYLFNFSVHCVFFDPEKLYRRPHSAYGDEELGAQNDTLLLTSLSSSFHMP